MAGEKKTMKNVCCAIIVLLSLFLAACEKPDVFNTPDKKTYLLLKQYEVSKDSTNLRNWIFEERPDFETKLIYIILVDWSSKRAPEFLKLTEGFDASQKKKFADNFGFSVVESSQENKFSDVFKEKKSETLELIRNVVICTKTKTCGNK